MMTTIIEASKEDLNSFLEMALDLWGVDYADHELKEIFVGALQSENFKVLLLPDMR